MTGIELAAKCNKCGQWNGLNTSDVYKARMYCKVSTCNHIAKIRQSKNVAHTWNLKVRFLPLTIKLDEFVRYLNGPYMIEYKTKGRRRKDKTLRRRDEAIAEGERVITARLGPTAYTLIRMDVEDGF